MAQTHLKMAQTHLKLKMAQTHLKNSKWLKMAQTHLKMAQTHLNLKMAQTHLKLISKIQNGSKWFKLISKWLKLISNHSMVVRGVYYNPFQGSQGPQEGSKAKILTYCPKNSKWPFSPVFIF